MKKIVLFSLCVCLGACTSSVRLSPVAGTQPADFSWRCQRDFPNGQPQEKVLAPRELDVRSCDISSWDFTAYTAQELADVLTFDSKTQFPPKNKMPKGFYPKRVLENGKNPSLSVRALHKQGITGQGVKVAILDQNLLLDHKDYADNLRYYWQDSIYQQYAYSSASMHGPAVASILAGKTVGVAPQVNLYYWATKFENTADAFNAQPVTQALTALLHYNFYLVDHKNESPIRVVSISRGFNEQDYGATEFKQAVKELEERGTAVFTTNDVFTLSRTHSLTNPNGTDYCRPAYWLNREEYPNAYKRSTNPLVPTDFRTTAAPNGLQDYVHYATGGLSWAVPYLSGLYALGVQVYPQLTKEIFLQVLRDTSDTKQCNYLGVSFTAPRLINPTAYINRLQQMAQDK